MFKAIRFNFNRYKSLHNMKKRSTEEIHSKMLEIKKLYLKYDREENENMATLYKSQLDVFEWMLGL